MDHGQIHHGGLNLPTLLDTHNAPVMTRTDVSKVSSESFKKGTSKVKSSSNTLLLRLSGKSDSRTRRQNQKLLRRAIRRIRSRITKLKDYRHEITIK